jgi:hypothetical protein
MGEELLLDPNRLNQTQTSAPSSSRQFISVGEELLLDPNRLNQTQTSAPSSSRQFISAPLCLSAPAPSDCTVTPTFCIIKFCQAGSVLGSIFEI